MHFVISGNPRAVWMARSFLSGLRKIVKHNIFACPYLVFLHHLLHSCNYEILGGKTIKNAHIDPQTTEIW